MKALVYHGPHSLALEERPRPTIIEATDAIVRIWASNITLTTRLVDASTTPMLLKMVQSGRLDPKRLVSHRFNLSEIIKAYDTFGNAAKEHALKVVINNASAS